MAGTMIPFEQAYDMVMSRVRPLEPEAVDLREAAGRILAQNVCSDMDMPPFDKSAMDGFACRRKDLPGPLRVLETIPAGSVPTRPVGVGECSKIMTGAMIPQGADCVIMVEYTETQADDCVLFTRGDTLDNICRQGEDIRAGDIVLERGAKIVAQHVAVLATVGCVRPMVARRPRVGVIATGDELVEPHLHPGPGQIRTSNSYQICAHLESAGAQTKYYGIVQDTEAAIDAALKKAIAENDVVVLSGGVSMGDFDLVPGVMTRNGIEILFDSIAMKPGKPTTFGVGESVYCFGLPGNPVSTFVQCEILVKPFLYALMGHAHRPSCSILPLESEFRRKRADREAWIPVSITPEGRVRIGDYHGSAHINALCQADGFVVVPTHTTLIEKDTLVRVRSL